jgi:hypothetical protein
MGTEGSEGVQEEENTGWMTGLSIEQWEEELGLISRRQLKCQTDKQGMWLECEARQETIVVLLEYKEGEDKLY